MFMVTISWLLRGLFVLTQTSDAKKENTKTATLVFGGDVSFSGPVKYFAENGRGCDYKKPFDMIKPYLSDADFTIVNLETPLVTKNPENNELLPGKNVKIAGEPDALEGLKYAGVDAVTVANNHFLDFGGEGANITLSELKKIKINSIGATYGKSKSAKQKPLVKTINGLKVGFLAYCYFRDGCDNARAMTKVGPALYRKEIALQDIMSLHQKHKVDISIVLMHWGIEMVPVPSLFMRKLAIDLVELGAHAVIGCHPHVTQGHEYVGLGSPQLIEYSMGNLLFPSRTSMKKVFRPYGKASDKFVKEFAKSAMVPWDTTRYGYLIKVKFSPGKILGAWVKHFDIAFNASNNCLQPTPDDTDWVRVCANEDRAFCLDFEKIYSPARREPFDTDRDAS